MAGAAWAALVLGSLAVAQLVRAGVDGPTAMRLAQPSLAGPSSNAGARQLRYTAPQLGSAERPNIIVYLLDDVGHGDFGFTGHPIARTPNFDGFAKSATRLTTLYAGAPICSPSRAALLSGRFADATGVWELVSPGASEMQLQPDALILGNVLAQAGYACAQLGKWHVSHINLEVGLSAYGFERLTSRRHYAFDQASIIVDWLGRQINASRPAFVYWDPHVRRCSPV